MGATTSPWTDPELVALHRLPMHAVPHAERLALDGTWRFQLLPRPDAEPGDAWTEAAVPGCWTMQGLGDLPQYTNVVMPWDRRPPAVPEANPTGLYERTFEVPEAWAGRRVVLHVGAAESVLLVRLNGHDVGVSKDSHLAAEFDLSGLLAAGENTLTLRVVKWSDASYIEDQDQWWHGGTTRSVYLYATGPVYLADVHPDAGLTDDLAGGTLALTVDVGFSAEPAPGWVVEARSHRAWSTSPGSGAGRTRRTRTEPAPMRSDCGAQRSRSSTCRTCGPRRTAGTQTCDGSTSPTRRAAACGSCWTGRARFRRPTCAPPTSTPRPTTSRCARCPRRSSTSTPRTAGSARPAAAPTRRRTIV